MIIAIDSGNTYAKVGWFDQEKLVRFQARLVWKDLIEEIRLSKPDHIVFSSVSYTVTELKSALGVDIPILELSPQTPLPIRKNYDTPETLGADRVAAAVGAQVLYPNEDLLIIDMGTCITYDFLEHTGSFEGGIISPGLRMRFNAMHTFTKRLPQLEPEAIPDLIGKSTKGAMESGVMNGVLAEIEGIIERYRHISPNLSVIMCGGDTTFFESSLKPSIFVVPELVLIGLNRILRYNVAL